MTRPSLRRPSMIREWGSTAAERASTFGCDALAPAPSQVLFRAVDVDADVATTFRWLCQLRAAPYSYDKLDNFGRRSPQTLTPGLERLELGQKVCTIFRLVAFDERSLTILVGSRLYGRMFCTYRADAAGPERSRIVVKIAMEYTGPLAWPVRLILPPGDLVMMRRQLLNLAGLAAT